MSTVVQCNTIKHN